MNFLANITNGNCSIDLFSSLPDGQYWISVKEVEHNPLVSARDYQKLYFTLLDEIVYKTGNEKYTLHEMFKDEYNIASTKGQSIDWWQSTIKTFKWWVYKELDIIL